MYYVAKNEKHTDLISFVLAKFWLALSLALGLWIDAKNNTLDFSWTDKNAFQSRVHKSHLSKAVGFDLKTHPKLIFECSIFQVTFIQPTNI